jgi:hypothetical protein
MRLLGRKQTRIALTIVGAVALLIGVTLVFLRDRSQSQLTVTFQGFSNLDGKKYVVFHVPSITTKRPTHWVWNNPFWQTHYQLKAEFAAGKTGTERNGRTTWVRSQIPTGEELIWPVFEGEEVVRITNVVCSLHRQWIKIKLPFALPKRECILAVPPPQPIPK